MRKKGKEKPSDVRGMDRRLRRRAKKNADLSKAQGGPAHTTNHNTVFASMQGRFQTLFLAEVQEKSDAFERKYGRRPNRREQEKIEAQAEEELVPNFEASQRDITRVYRGRGVYEDEPADRPDPDPDLDEEEFDDEDNAPPTAPPVPRNDITSLIRDFMG
jgi:hypothetical protein